MALRRVAQRNDAVCNDFRFLAHGFAGLRGERVCAFRILVLLVTPAGQMQFYGRASPPLHHAARQLFLRPYVSSIAPPQNTRRNTPLMQRSTVGWERKFAFSAMLRPPPPGRSP